MTETRTQAERVLAALQDDVLRGALRPGQRLAFGMLGERYQASVGVLREALMRLTERGLVDAEPRYGFRVIELSQADLSDLTEARRELEVLALRKAIEEGDLAWESSVVAGYHVLARTPPHADADAGDALTPAWLAAHATFHTVLISGCGNRHLRNLAGSLRDKAELYRNWCLPPAEERALALAEHAQLNDAVLARDADRAAAVLSEHIARTDRAITMADEERVQVS